MRPKKGCEIWQDSHVVMFYDIVNDYCVAMFETIKEIIAYKGLPYNKQNYDLVQNELYRALKRPTHYTEMLGRPMTVYLIDTNYEE